MESADRPELDEVAAEVRSLHETDRWRMARRIALVGGVFVIGIAATILGVSEYQYRKACATEASHPAWVQKLVAMRNDPSFRAAIMSDDKLKANLPDLLDKVAAVVNSADRPLIPTPAAFAAARNGAHNLEALTQFLGREWGPAQDVRQLEQDATQLGWSQVAEDLKQLTQGMPYYDANGLPHDGTEQVEPKLVWLIQHGASTRGTFEATKRAWDTASNDVAGLSNPDAKVLESGLQKFIGATEGLNDLQLALLGVKDDCENLQEYVQSVNSSEKYEGLCSGVKKAFAGAIPPDVAASLKKLEGFVKLDTLTPAAIQIENARAAEANSLAQLDKAGEPNASEHAKLSKIVDALQVIQNKKWRQFESPDLNNAYAAIQQQQNDLESNLALDKQKLVVRDWVTTLDAESSDLQKAYPTLATAIGGLKTDAAIAQMAGNAGLFQNRQRFLSAEGWTGFLPRLDDQSQAACDLPGDFKDVKQMMGDWVAAVKAALPPVSVDAAPPSMDQLAQTVKASPWYKHLKQVDADFPEGRLPPLTVLAKWEPLYQRWLGINSKPVDRQFWNVQVASPGGELNSVPRLQLPVAQLSAMDATVNKPPADLVKTSMSSTMDLTALAAGRRLLDQSADAKTWPLAQVARWFKAISTADSFRLTKDDFAELEPLRRSQWIQAVNCAASEPEVKLTVDSAPDFQIDLANVEGLASSIQPKACYNLLVYLARNPPGGRAVVDSVAIGKAVAKLPAADAVMGKKALSSASPGDWFSQSMGDNKWYYFGSYSPPVQPPQTNNTTVVKTQTQDKPKPKRPNFDDPKSTVGNGG
jgi:hypothetical protein